MIKANSNIKDLLAEYTAKLNSLSKGGQGYDSTLREVATTMRAEVSRRIHSDGKNSNDAVIGNYSTKSMYVSLSAIPRPKGVGRGKGGKTKFENGKPHKSKYYAGGYFGYKTDVGRNRLGTVNLSLTGQVSNQFSVIATSDSYGLGWSNTEMQNRAAALEKKYGQDSFKVWALTEAELNLSNEIAQNQINKILNS